MRKPITPRLHSIIDYGFAAGNLLLPTLLGMQGRARLLFAGFGIAQGTLNALTVQPIAVRKIVPFALHGVIEKSSAPIYLLSPVLTGVAKEPKARTYWLALLVVLVAVYNLTDWTARRTDR